MNQVISMNVILVSIDAKYIHTNNAVRLLKANSVFPITLMEYTIKDDVNQIAQNIITENPDIVGFSVYIWNVTIIQEILQLLPKDTFKIILGGPEVSYDQQYFLEHTPADFIVSGEGEHTFNSLVTHLKQGTSYQNLPGIAFYHNQQLFINPLQEIEDIRNLKPPYYFEEDISHIPHKIGYIESSRGCPYKCSYCLSSLEKSVRFFDVAEVKKAISYLMEHGAKTIKFLDRTFNANKHTLSIIDYIIEHDNYVTVFQFEITGDVLPEALVTYINTHARSGLFRFEIGIQSTNDHTNKLVDRIQKTDVLFQRINQIQDGNVIDLHLDLIAGLPQEDKQSFIHTFNQVYKLGAKELQLGFLKMLRGTKIRFQADLYNYRFNREAPYEILENNVLSQEDIQEIKAVEHMLELYHNKGYFGPRMATYIQTLESPYHFFLSIANEYQTNNYDIHRYQIVDVYQRLLPLIEEATAYELYKDYLERSKIKPHIFFDLHCTKEERNQLYTSLSIEKNIPLHLLYKHSVLFIYQEEYFCVYYRDNISYTFKGKAPLN